TTPEPTAIVQAPQVAGSDSAAGTEEASKPKVVTVKRKTKAQKEEEDKKAQEAKEEAASAAAAAAAAAAKEERDENPNVYREPQQPKKEYFEEKPHVFTPIYIPEEKKEDTTEKRASENRLQPKRDEDAGLTDDEKDK